MSKNKPEGFEVFLTRHRAFILYFGFLYLALLWPVYTMQQSFLHGDYGLAFYPFSYLYAQGLKHFHLPLWTNLIHSGFPLFGEGQTGALYFLNLISFFLLPFRWAYNGLFLLHYLMGGLFCYGYSKKGLGLSGAAATLSAMIFTFGSNYAGCFYNLVTMRALVWFPLLLLLVDIYVRERKKFAWILLALIQAQSWLGGFPQMALYSSGFMFLYALIRLRQKHGFIPWKDALLFLASIFVAVLAALPQFWATFSWASVSTRVLHDKSFVFWGSVAPGSLLSLFIPEWSAFLNLYPYIGVAPLFLLLVQGRKESSVHEGAHWFLLGFALFFMLGMYNPVNWILLRAPGVSMLRNPAKFIFFFVFSLGCLAAMRFDGWLKTMESGYKIDHKKICNISTAWFVLAGLGWILPRIAQKPLLWMGNWYVQNFVLHKSYHRASAESYFSRIPEYLKQIQQSTEIYNFFVWWPLFLVLVATALFNAAAKQRLSKKTFTFFFLGLVALDFWVFAMQGERWSFRGNLKDWKTVVFVDAGQEPAVRIDATAEGKESPPNRNILQATAVPGVYAPMIHKDYYRLIVGIASMDDSFGVQKPQLEQIRQSRGLVNFIGVKYLIADEPLSWESWTLASHLNGKYYYENKSTRPEFSIVFTTKQKSSEETLTYLRSSEYDPGKEALVEENGIASTGESAVQIKKISDEKSLVTAHVSSKALLVRRVLWDEGWLVRDNGKTKCPLRVNGVFQGVYLDPGTHDLEWFYRPASFYQGRWLFLGIHFFLILGLIMTWRRAL